MAIAHLNATMDHAKGPEAYANVICVISKEIYNLQDPSCSDNWARFQLAPLGKRHDLEAAHLVEECTVGIHPKMQEQ